MKIKFLISILIISILSGCIYPFGYEPRTNNPYVTNTPYQERYYPLRPVSDKVDLDLGNKWNIGSGYVLTINAIDAKASPKQIWLSLFKDGKQVDDIVLAEGDKYNYQNMFKTNVDRIYTTGDADRVILTNTMVYP